MLIEPLFIIFSIIFLGFSCQKIRLLKETHIEGFQIFLYKIATPCFLFTSIVHQDYAQLIHLPYIFSYLLSFCAIATITFLAFKNRPLSDISLKILASGYANTAIYTIPVTTFLLGDPIAGVISNFLQVIVIQSIFIIILNISCHKERSTIKKLVQIIFTPLVIMPIIGLLLNVFNFVPNPTICIVIKNLGIAAPSMGLFLFGLTLGSIKIRKENITLTMLCMAGFKNILHPLIAFCVGKYIFNLNQYWLYSLIIATSAPTAFVVYILAKQFSKNSNEVKVVLALTAIISTLLLITMTFFFVSI